MKRYEVTGIPLGPSLVLGHAVGHVIDADISEDEERALIGAGAIRVIETPAEPESEPEPEPEPQLEGADGSEEQPAEDQ